MTIRNAWGLVFTFVVLAALVFAGAAWFLNVQQAKPSSTLSAESPSAILMRTSQDFQTARDYQKKSDYVTARSYYEKALPAATTPAQEAQIKFNIAAMTELDGDYVKAIQLFKEIAANKSYSALFRATAIQELGLIRYGFYDARVNGVDIPGETFKGEPYASFKTDDLNRSYRNLFEYAAGIYPLGPSEAYIALLYSVDLLNSKATTTPDGIAMLARINASAAAAEKDVQRVKNDPVAAARIPDILVHEGLALTNLAVLGATSPQRVEAIFKDALQFATITGMMSGNFAPYHYASFLSRYYGIQRSKNVRSLLTVYRQSNAANIYKTVSSFFQDVRTDPAITGERKNVVTLGRMDPDFRAYLISLGWHETDFPSPKIQ
ncbi:hypothetical protein K8R03_01650 [Candidatus Kaiserbacteria bacterium]|nr:hypothetical protein [Candidatus Kaiserbacteria bacterium]